MSAAIPRSPTVSDAIGGRSINGTAADAQAIDRTTDEAASVKVIAGPNPCSAPSQSAPRPKPTGPVQHGAGPGGAQRARPKTAHDAVLAAALHHFAERCRGRGGRITLPVAERIAAIAGTFGIQSTRALGELGLDGRFMLSDDDLWRALVTARQGDCGDDLRRLECALSDLAVRDIEGYEPHEHRLGADDSGVFRVSCLPRMANRRARR